MIILSFFGFKACFNLFPSSYFEYKFDSLDTSQTRLYLVDPPNVFHDEFVTGKHVIL